MEENPLPWDTVRTAFPAFRDRVFLDAACVSVMPQRAHATVTHFSGELLLPSEHNATGHHVWVDAQQARTPPEVAKLLGVDLRHIALVESTTHGLNIAAQAIPWQRGDEILMCDLEFLQVAIPFVKLAERGQVTTRFLRHRDGVVDADAFIKRRHKIPTYECLYYFLE